MRRDIIDKVEIVEPPLQELSKGRSGWKRACVTGCGCVFIFIIGSIIALRLAVGPGPQTLKSVPSNFPADIPVYDKDTIDKITFISGQYKNRGLEIAAFFPKLILSPFLLAMNRDSTTETPAPTSTTMIEKQADALRKLWKLVITPIGDHRDSIEIEWKNMDAEPSFVISYYKKELLKHGYKIDVQSEGSGIRQFSFSNASGLSGSLYAQGDEENKPGTDYAILTVNLPIQISR